MNDYLVDIREFSNNTTTEIRQCQNDESAQCGIEALTSMIENLQAVKLFAQIRYRQYSNLCHTLGAFAMAEKFSLFSDQVAQEESTLGNLIAGTHPKQHYEMDPMEGKYSLCSVPASVITMVQEKLAAERIASKTSLMIADYAREDYADIAANLEAMADAEHRRIHELENFLEF